MPESASPQAADDLDGGGLAGPVAAQHAEDLAAVDLEADVVDGDGVAVALVQVLDLDDGHGRSFSEGVRCRGSGAVPVPERVGWGQEVRLGTDAPRVRRSNANAMAPAISRVAAEATRSGWSPPNQRGGRERAGVLGEQGETSRIGPAVSGRASVPTPAAGPLVGHPDQQAGHVGDDEDQRGADERSRPMPAVVQATSPRGSATASPNAPKTARSTQQQPGEHDARTRGPCRSRRSATRARGSAGSARPRRAPAGRPP